MRDKNGVRSHGPASRSAPLETKAPCTSPRPYLESLLARGLSMKRGLLSRLGEFVRQLFPSRGTGVKGSGCKAWVTSIASKSLCGQPDPLTPAFGKLVVSHHGLLAAALLRHVVAFCLPVMVGAVLISLSPALGLDQADGRLAPAAHLLRWLSRSQARPNFASATKRW